MIEAKENGFSWDRLILTAATLCYGFWGYGPSLSKMFDFRSEPKAALHSLVYTFILIASLGYTIRIFNNQAQYKYVLKINKKIIMPSAAGLIYTALVFPKLLNSNFTGDELSYLQNSFSYARIVSTEFSRNISWLQSAPYFITLSICSILFTLAAYFLIYKTLRNQLKLNPVLIIGLVLLLRLSNDHILRFGSAYPNLYGTFLQSFSFLSLFPIVVRSIQWIFISTILIMTYEKYWNNSKFGTFSFAMICLPLLGLSSSWTAIEPSIFFVVTAFSVMTLLLKKPENYIPLSLMILSLCTLLRATSIILLPLVMVFSFSEFRKNKKIAKAYFPLAILAPYILETGYENLTSQLKGNRYNDVSIYSADPSPFVSLIKSIQFQFKPIILAMVLFSLLFILVRKQTRLLTLSYILIIFPIYALMIPNATRGLNKYALEILIPLILISSSCLLEHSLRNSRRLIVAALVIGSTYTNIIQASSISDIDRRIENWRQVPLTVNYPVENYTAYKSLKTLSFANKCYNPGTTYGVFPFVLSGYSIVQIDSLTRVFNDNPSVLIWGSNSVDVSKIKASCLIIDNFPIKKELLNRLEASDWEMIYKSKTNRVGTEVAIWKKAPLRDSEELLNP